MKIHLFNAFNIWIHLRLILPLLIGSFLLFYSIEFSRKTDSKGRPYTPTIGRRLSFSTEIYEDTFLTGLATNYQNKPFYGQFSR